MKNIKTIPSIVMIIMSFLSFTNIFGLRIAGLAVGIGVGYFFKDKVFKKEPYKDSGFDFNEIQNDFEDKSIWIWFLLPIIMDAVCITIAKLFLPQYIEHVLARTVIFVSIDRVVLMVGQLAFLALGEEIAWRAFFQNQLNKALPIVPTLLISSALFAIGHISDGPINTLIYDIFFVFINSILYGIIFYKTKNAWVSAVSHFTANLFSIFLLLLLR